MSKKSNYIDVAHIRTEDCEERKFPLEKLKAIKKRPDGFQIVVNQSALNAMKAHGRTSMHAEVGGMLVGYLYRDEGGPYLLIEAAIVGAHADGNAASVTFTAETWTHVYKVQEEKYSETKIVGWYHTHPGFGIFLSHMDLFICQHTFNAPHQVAYVYDPCSEDEGWFIWKQSRSKKIEPLIIEDEPALPVTISTHSLSSRFMCASADKIVISSEDHVSKWRTVATFISTALLFVCAISLACLVLHSVSVQKELENKIVQLKSEIKELKEENQMITDNFREIGRWSEGFPNPPRLMWETPKPTQDPNPIQEEPQQRRSIFIPNFLR